MKKKILVALLIIFILPFLWILIEFIHFKVLSHDKPIVVLDEIFCSKDSTACYDENGYYTHIYYGIGFSVRLTYRLDEHSLRYRNVKTRYPNYTVVKREFYPFNFDY